jgi:NADH-quinone oxidoreductase subunit K
MMSVYPEHYFVLATFVFLCGVTGVLFRRNLIMVMMSIELMLNAANLAFVAASKATGTLDGQVMVLFVTAIAACEAAVGLALVIAVYRRFGSIDTDWLRSLRG